MPRIIIAIVDIVTNDIVGPLQVFPHEAPAIRMFGDVAADERTQIHAHVVDHHLIRFGYLNDDLTIEPNRDILITGAQWLAVNSKKEQGE